jgi:hypothetical protein
MYFRLLISKFTGSKVCFPGFFALGDIHFALGGVLFSLLADENSMAC